MNDEVFARLTAHPFVAVLDRAHLAALSGFGTPVSLPANERLFGEGGTADRFWLIETGSVALDMRVPGRGDQVVETLRAGTVLGWSWLYPPYRWHLGAVTREATAAVVFDAASVRHRCETDHGFGYAILCSFTPIVIERLQAARLRLLDLYASATQVGQP